MKCKSQNKKNLRSLQKASSLLLFVIVTIYFLWIEEKRVTSPQLNPTDFPTLLSSPQQIDLQKSFLSAIEEAQQSVLLIVYSLTDRTIIQTLRNQSEKGVAVTVITDAKASPYIDNKLGAKVHTLKRLGEGLMHQKILVVDNAKCWIGSANMTNDSLKLHDNLVLACHCPSLADFILQKANSYTEYDRLRTFPYQTFNVGGQKAEMWFLPDNPDASKKIIQLIRSAQKTIRVAMFTWTRHDFAKEIVAAHKRGVDVQIVVDRNSAKGVSKKVVDFVREQGIASRLSQNVGLLHHKFLYIDGKTLVNGSANWTKAAFKQNDDCFIILFELSEKQRAAMNALWDQIF